MAIADFDETAVPGQSVLYLEVPAIYAHLVAPLLPDQLKSSWPNASWTAASRPGTVYGIAAEDWPALQQRLLDHGLAVRWQAEGIYLVQQNFQVGSRPGDGLPAQGDDWIGDADHAHDPPPPVITGEG